MVNIVKNLRRPKGHYFSHQGRQQGWQQRGYQAFENYGQLSDEEINESLQLHDPLWRYIVRHYTKEVYGENLAKVNVLGYQSLPIAIELSQWSYPITFLTPFQEHLRKAKKDYEIHAGFVKENYWFNFYNNVPNAAVTTFIGIIHQLQVENMYKFIDMLLRRSEEVVCSVPDTHEWNVLFEDRYDFFEYRYPNGDGFLLSLKERED